MENVYLSIEYEESFTNRLRHKSCESIGARVNKTKSTYPTQQIISEFTEMESKVDLSALQKQLEYYLSDKNLKQDEFFYNKLKESQDHSIPVDLFLNCNKVKQLNASKEDIVSALKKSSDLELLPDLSGVKRKNEHLPDFESKNSKKLKKDEYEESKGEGGFEEFIFEFTISKIAEEVKWNIIMSEIEKSYGVKVVYCRLNQTEGHFAVNRGELTDELKKKLIEGGLKIGDVDIKITECTDDSLKKFYKDHGRHIDTCLERVGLKKKKKGDKPNEFIFMNQRYNAIGKLKTIFKNILQKSSDGEHIPEPDHTMLYELLKHHDKFEEKTKGLKYFTAGQHPEYKQTRCFFVVDENGNKQDFSAQKCLDSIKKKYNLPE